MSDSGTSSPPDTATTVRDSVPDTTESTDGTRKTLEEEKGRLNALGRSRSRSDAGFTALNVKVDDMHEMHDGKPRNDANVDGEALQPTTTHERRMWKFHMRAADDDDPE